MSIRNRGESARNGVSASDGDHGSGTGTGSRWAAPQVRHRSVSCRLRFYPLHSRTGGWIARSDRHGAGGVDLGGFESDAAERYCQIVVVEPIRSADIGYLGRQGVMAARLRRLNEEHMREPGWIGGLARSGESS